MITPLLMALLAVLIAGCTGVPGTGPVVAVGTGPSEPVAPTPAEVDKNLAPDQVVRQFLESSADTSRDVSRTAPFQTARNYLTEAASKSWQPQNNTTQVVVLDAVRVNAPTAGRAAANQAEVDVQGTQLAVLDADNAYRATAPTEYNHSFGLVREQGEWRISNPPNALVLTQSQFDAAFKQRMLYFVSQDGEVLVPDPRWIIPGPSPKDRAAALVDLLLGGASIGLSPAVQNRLDGGRLRGNVELDPQNGDVKVDLTGVQPANQQAQLQLIGQLVDTLAPTEAPGVQISIDGQLLGGRAYTPRDTQSLDAEQIPAVGPSVPADAYYVNSGGHVLSLSSGEAMWGELGHSAQVKAASMSAANGAVAAVVTSGEQQKLTIGRPLQYQPSTTVLTADRLTAPTFDRSGSSVWVVQQTDDKTDVRQLTTTAPFGQQSVTVPDLADLGQVTALERSPDGARVALVADKKLYLGTVVESDAADGAETGRRAVSIVGPTEINPRLTDVGPIAFQSASTLLVGGKQDPSSVFVTLLQVTVDGVVTTPNASSDISDDVTDIAVGNQDIFVCFQGRVWKLDGTLLAGVWEPAGSQAGAQTLGSRPFAPN
ncbi:LpqB family beta-propeller domain-containing protein [Nakamurella aerolata]|uniref:Sporulation and spore germination protein n=1 Tax=Nakamurella aerolata TaxID=1656892 RepID=A0A849AAS0_9ACTN|nr:LpqB family beta-propeller domain-containing protein [Nakamurella aerolata]NNG36676.1 hypothetical protein [Nakamurella aerolata]